MKKKIKAAFKRCFAGNMKKAISTAMALLVVFALSAKHIEIKGTPKISLRDFGCSFC